MTRGEALLAMEGGARVRQVWGCNGVCLTFNLHKVAGESVYLECDSVEPDINSAFMFCTEYELVPEPDTAEKFVREFNATCPSGPLPDYWETFIQKFFKRSNDLIQQMDGEK